MEKRVAIIGAGVCGLTTAKCCLDEGVDIVVFERSKNTGGLWRFQNDVRSNGSLNQSDGTATVMHSTVINSSKELSAFSDFPPPDHFPNYMHNTQMMEYLDQYGNNFNFNAHVRLQHEVISVTPTINHESTGQWQVRYKDLRTDLESNEVFDAVYICTGHHGYKSMPDPLPGQETFRGKIIHSHDVKTGEHFRNQRIVVVGLGNSGADLAAELSPIAKQVYVSIRHGTWVVHRVGPFGLPLDLFYLRRIVDILLRLLPYWLFCSCFENFVNTRFDHDRYRLKPSNRILSQHITVNDALPNLIISGRTQIRSKIERFTVDGVVFDDGQMVKVDTVIFATGYRIQFPFLSNSLVQVERNQIPLYKFVFPPHLPQPHTLAFIGLVQPLGPIMPAAELQARWAVKLLVNGGGLPNEQSMMKDIELKYKQMERFYESERHTVSFDWIPYMDEIATEIGSMPPLWKYFFTDPKLWFQLIFGCAGAYQYRLVGKSI
ncbi:hypothetical protein RDWZM_004011 [Blomia tropicalis]|uniref:Flavin-containing monooxygenase n=1 Tax=Blomia tropicalis TaxID=40697 RepID=A0A9Q0MGG0_BLOTA|nr:hypothetical protein RDWZM_004011 [Blomia tropicalis]